MAERRAKFEKKFRNVWSTGPTGVSYIQMTAHDMQEELISKLFKHTMIADEYNVVKSVKRTYTYHGHESFDGDRHHLTFITSDDRVAEVIEAVADWYNEFDKGKIPFDLVVIPLATGSKDYIEWVKLQTLKKDDETAFFNEKAMKALKPLTGVVNESNLVQSEEDLQTGEEVQGTKSLWGGEPEEDE